MNTFNLPSACSPQKIDYISSEYPQLQSFNSYNIPQTMQQFSLSKMQVSMPNFPPCNFNATDSYQFIDKLLNNAQNTITLNQNLIQSFESQNQFDEKSYLTQYSNYPVIATPAVPAAATAPIQRAFTDLSAKQSFSEGQLYPIQSSLFDSCQSTNSSTNDSQDNLSENNINLTKTDTSKRTRVIVVDLVEPSVTPYPYILTEEDLRIAEKRQIRLMKIAQYRSKRRNWKKQVSYDCRKAIADSRIRVKGRFVSKKETKTIQKMVGESTKDAFNSKRNLRLDFINSQITSEGKVNSAISKNNIIQCIEKIIQDKEIQESTPQKEQ